MLSGLEEIELEFQSRFVSLSSRYVLDRADCAALQAMISDGMSTTIELRECRREREVVASFGRFQGLAIVRLTVTSNLDQDLIDQ